MPGVAAGSRLPMDEEKPYALRPGGLNAYLFLSRARAHTRGD
jgi:hypothetical protein